MSSSDEDDHIVDRMKSGRSRQDVSRDDSSDGERDLDRRRGGNRANQRHRQRARDSTSEDESDSDADTKAIMKKKQPNAKRAMAKAKSSAVKRREIERLKKKRQQDKNNKKGGLGGDLAFEIDSEDMPNSTVLPLEERTDFFKLQGGGLGLDDAQPLLSVADFNLSVESVVREAQAEAKRGRSSTLKKSWVYVENMATGKFKKVHMGRLGYSRLVDNDHDDDDESGQSLTGPDLMDDATHSITALISGVFQFAQGLLAGLALLHLFLVSSITAFGTFTSVYQPLSNESRRLYFLLASLGLSSAIETFLREVENKELWATLSPMQKIRILTTCFLYLTACGFSLGMMPTDALISSDPTKVSTGRLSLWNSFEYIRSVASILGWVLACVGIHEENQNGRRLLIHCSSLRTDLDKQKLRLQNMSGKHLDSASPEELEDLVLVQRAAVKSTERAIEFYRKRTEARGGRASPKRGSGFGSPSKV